MSGSDLHKGLYRCVEEDTPETCFLVPSIAMYYMKGTYSEMSGLSYAVIVAVSQLMVYALALYGILPDRFVTKLV